MKYEEAVTIVQDTYHEQAEALISSLAPEAIIALARCAQENIRRDLTEESIEQLAEMEPHRQKGYIANPYMQNLMDTWLGQFSCGYCPSTATDDQAPEPTADDEPVTKPKPEVDPEPEPDDGLMGLFD